MCKQQHQQLNLALLQPAPGELPAWATCGWVSARPAAHLSAARTPLNSQLVPLELASSSGSHCA